ncbi:hypothetical protein Pst134EA_032619 [Puccinia striiformis f. sp. tritici]|uniref:uncharacterized protein n=1 Tax=Puccinia striiformis f. sp. tritici TaxID=168172 RepID=UPI002008C827|nr:uncharacterized protein Pst134EA_032619 [Puccinia striiformis f. sp. tritici]KAH9443554.1 hypothetical protein Pst134EA_032619 [Puccinia striiformis f. sp. tritici]
MNQSKSIFPDPKDQLSDGHWTWVSNQMGGSRSRSQCRIKWAECVQPKSLAGGKRRRMDKSRQLNFGQTIKENIISQDDVVGFFDWKQLRTSTPQSEIESEPKSVTTGDCQPENTAEEATDKSQPESIAAVDPVHRPSLTTLYPSNLYLQPPIMLNLKSGLSLVTKSKHLLSTSKPKSGTGVKPRSLLLKEFTSAEFVDDDSS